MKFPILLPNIFNHPFTYKSNLDLKVGDYVVVPFGKSKIIGVVWNEFETKNDKKFIVKDVIKKLNIYPLKKKTINFLNLFAIYNIILKKIILKLLFLSNKAIEKFTIDKYQYFEPKIKLHGLKLSEEQDRSLKHVKHRHTPHVKLSMLYRFPVFGMSVSLTLPFSIASYGFCYSPVVLYLKAMKQSGTFKTQ